MLEALHANVDKRSAVAGGGDPGGSADGAGGAPRGIDPEADQLVELNTDHPGFRDPIYRARRNAIARLALEHREGTPPPDVAYTDVENEVWRSVWEHLTPLHAARAVREWRDAAARLDLDRRRVPQLAEVNELTRSGGIDWRSRIAGGGDPNGFAGGAGVLPRGIEMHPVAGLIAAQQFLSALGRGVFRSTQYMRHHSMPLYTPEPDVIHELVGHATSFLAPEIVQLSRAFGEAALRADAATQSQLERLYWYTLEFGVALEDGEVKAYGAGLLSSYGELGDLGARAQLVPFDLEVMVRSPYDPTDYQKILFVAPSFAEMVRQLDAWLAAV